VNINFKGETMSKTATQRFTGEVEPKKHSVRFNASEKEKYPMFSGAYLSREFAAHELGVKDLDKYRGIEITVKVIE
jgi:hypothetical protein